MQFRVENLVNITPPPHGPMRTYRAPNGHTYQFREDDVPEGYTLVGDEDVTGVLRERWDELDFEVLVDRMLGDIETLHNQTAELDIAPDDRKDLESAIVTAKRDFAAVRDAAKRADGSLDDLLDRVKSLPAS